MGGTKEKADETIKEKAKGTIRAKAKESIRAKAKGISRGKEKGSRACVISAYTLVTLPKSARISTHSRGLAVYVVIGAMRPAIPG